MCQYFCIAFIDFMLKGKSLLNYSNLFCPYGRCNSKDEKIFKENDSIKILNILGLINNM